MKRTFTLFAAFLAITIQGMAQIKSQGLDIMDIRNNHSGNGTD